MDNSELNKLVALLNKKNLTVSFAESVTAGMVSYQFSKALNVTQCFKGGIVAYSEEVKSTVLKVNEASLEKYTAESGEVTQEMAQGLKLIYDSSIAIALTGLANPGGSESPQKASRNCLCLHSIRRQAFRLSYLFWRIKGRNHFRIRRFCFSQII